jgi:hypothetical protein
LSLKRLYRVTKGQGHGSKKIFFRGLKKSFSLDSAWLKKIFFAGQKKSFPVPCTHLHTVHTLTAKPASSPHRPATPVRQARPSVVTGWLAMTG